MSVGLSETRSGKKSPSRRLRRLNAWRFLRPEAEVRQVALELPRTNGRIWLGLLVLALVVRGVTFPVHAQIDCRATGADCTLRDVARQVGVGVGAIREGGPPADLVLEEEFSSLTVTAYWNLTHPDPGVYDFSQPDATLAFAAARGMSTRGHTLIWDQQFLDATPEWVTTMIDADELRALMDEHIGTVVGHFRGRIDSWDVVNEPLQTLGSNLYENVFMELLGPGYIADAFRAANEADPDADLFLNEIVLGLGPVAGEAKLAALHDLVQDLLDQGVPIHGVGFQGHFFLPPVDSWVHAALRSFGDLGIAVEFTEADMPQRDVEDKEALQRDEYFQVVAACLAVPACRRITVWGVSDQYSWLNWFLEPGLAPLLFDDDFARKLAYEGFRDALLAYVPRDLSGERIAVRDHGRKPSRRRLRVATDAPELSARGPRGFGDLTELGGSLGLLNPVNSEEAIMDLPAAGWTGLGNPPGSRGYRFRDPDDGPCHQVLVRPGKRLRARCGGAGIDFTLNEVSQGALAVELRLADAPLQCLEFGGQVRRDRSTDAAGGLGLFRARAAPASSRCSLP